MQTVQSKIETLLKIYNIPFQENWEEWTTIEKYNVYNYWRALELLTAEEHKLVFINKKMISNPVFIQFFKNIDYEFKPAIYAEGNVADIGSGFGFITFWLVLSGAKRVYTIGDPARIGFIQKLYERAVQLQLLPPNSLSFKPSFVQAGDTTLSEDIEPNSLSLVLLNDTLEHITPRRFPSLVAATAHDLKKGGYFISRQQNTDSSAMLNTLRKVWERDEKTILIKQRYDIIKEKIKNIDEKDAEKLAKHTRGLDIVDFEQAIEDFRTKHIFPSHDLDIPPIDVIIDVPHEGNTSIARITAEFRKHNFESVKVYPTMSSSRLERLFRPLARIFPSIFLKMNRFNGSSVFIMKK